LHNRTRITTSQPHSQQDILLRVVSTSWLVQMVQQNLDESRKKKEEILNMRFEETRSEAIHRT
jgi:hypothetical protein